MKVKIIGNPAVILLYNYFVDVQRFEKRCGSGFTVLKLDYSKSAKFQTFDFEKEVKDISDLTEVRYPDVSCWLANTYQKDVSKFLSKYKTVKIR